MKNGSGAMFDQIANQYDLLNRIMSFGLDTWWRSKAVTSLQLKPSEHILDLATGTADFAIQLTKTDPTLQITALDPSIAMLKIGKQKISKYAGRISLLKGDAQLLPFPNSTFDAVSMAFGIRNVPHRQQALQEIYRVLKPNGKVAILELASPEPGLIQYLSNFYIRHVIPQIGRLFSKSAEYTYLKNSIQAFPPASEFIKMIQQCGFRMLQSRTYGFGACHLFTFQREKE